VENFSRARANVGIEEPLARPRVLPWRSLPSFTTMALIKEGSRSPAAGEIKGELRASDLLIGDGAQVEGSVIEQDVTVCGRVKGTIRAVRVKLQDGGAVEGDIFHRPLSIDENSLFEGSSRRVENPTLIISVARIRVYPRKSARAFKGIICVDISEFESSHPSHAVGLSQARSPAHTA
jgi:hypothetical protein